MPDRYTLPYGGREIYRDGKPFVVLTRHPIPDANGDDVGRYGATPVECDDFGRAIVEALNDLEPRTVEGSAGPVKWVCTECGSDDILTDAWARWDAKMQRYELLSTMDQEYCGKCDGECKTDEVPA